MEVYISEVVSIEDKADGGRIKARVLPADKHVADADLPYAFPAIPKMMHITPKVGEAVIVLAESFGGGQRYYIGPIISQEQYMLKDYFALGATNLLKGGNNQYPDYVISEDRAALGAMADDEDIALYGRKDTDVILKEKEVHLRAGSRITKSNKVSFNREDPSFIKLKHYDTPLTPAQNKNYLSMPSEHSKTRSTALVVADKIILASPSGDGGVNINNKGDLVSDDEMLKMIDRIHMLPYGDVLCDFLYMFLKMFMTHTHKYDNMPTSPAEPDQAQFYAKYGTTLESIEKKLLSKDIGIN